MSKPVSQDGFEYKHNAFYDVSDCVKSWGRRGILWGGLFGLALGIVFVAIPHTDKVLTFGVIGTLIVGMVEGAVVAGAFGVCAAALYSKGVLGDNITQRERMPSAGRRDGDIPLSDWPTMLSHPGSTGEHSLLEGTDDANPAVHSLSSVQTRLLSLEAWENGNTGP
jgi:hypothetical protein